jgi:hypothetical protein
VLAFDATVSRPVAAAPKVTAGDVALLAAAPKVAAVDVAFVAAAPEVTAVKVALLAAAAAPRVTAVDVALVTTAPKVTEVDVAMAAAAAPRVTEADVASVAAAPEVNGADVALEASDVSFSAEAVDETLTAPDANRVSLVAEAAAVTEVVSVTFTNSVATCARVANGVESVVLDAAWAPVVVKEVDLTVATLAAPCPMVGRTRFGVVVAATAPCACVETDSAEVRLEVLTAA